MLHADRIVHVVDIGVAADDLRLIDAVHGRADGVAFALGHRGYGKSVAKRSSLGGPRLTLLVDHVVRFADVAAQFVVAEDVYGADVEVVGIVRQPGFLLGHDQPQRSDEMLVVLG